MSKVVLILGWVCALACLAELQQTQNHKKLHALTVNFPLNFFSSNQSVSDWKKPALHDVTFAKESAQSKKYVSLTHAQDQEDLWLWENWFFGMKNGIILKSGAIDGVHLSTSLMFEIYADWTAIHIEGAPDNYAALKHNREKAINVHGAVCSSPQLLHYTHTGRREVRGFVEFMTPHFLKSWHPELTPDTIATLPVVQCLPVGQLFKALDIKHIDIWVLDVEGAELSALQGVDFSTVQINAIAMECDGEQKDNACVSLLQSKGYKCQHVLRNCMCKHTSYVPHRAPELTALKEWNGKVYNIPSTI